MKPSYRPRNRTGGDLKQRDEECEGSDGEEGDGNSSGPTLTLSDSSFTPEHVEPREVRVLLYGTVTPDVQEYKYKIRAGNAGKFAVPPVYAEAMYERGVWAQGAGGWDGRGGCGQAVRCS